MSKEKHRFARGREIGRRKSGKPMRKKGTYFSTDHFRDLVHPKLRVPGGHGLQIMFRQGASMEDFLVE
jgi:hypothetical protein